MTSPRERELERQRDRLAQTVRELYEYAATLEVMADANPDYGDRPVMRHARVVLEECR